MKQLANLYVQELHPRKQSLTFTRAAGVVAAAAVLAVVFSGASRWYAGQQQIATQRTNHELSQVQQRLTAKQNELRAAMNNPQVEQQITAIEAQLAQRQRLLQQMTSVTAASQTSFAQLLTDIAKADLESIWLQRVIAANSQLTLQGKTTDASALPQWLASFSNYPTLQERQFGVFELRDNSQEAALDFTVGSLAHSSLLSHSVRTAGAQ
ncbi:PilN domain-containing protein [Pseudidiomarina woesei]|uniref:Tfp pilus assembly protein PilN n=1 Tax=Pseudidiomarina woesei TaxID=1381080 RepID=A0A0K6H7T8_9GAMM|nr:PilN domain-containing protein [Pseudidiomarina woesei]CUA87056.1 hypothetical protein Ga0061064_1704 [Pseudidiomarina woesei]